MPYAIAQTELDALGAALVKYYDDAWQEGIKDLFAGFGRAKTMGLLGGYLDQAKDTYANLKKKSNDEFGVSFKATLKHYVGVYLANKSDVASALVTVAELALKQLTIPIPHFSVILPLIADQGLKVLHKASVTEADQQLGEKTGAAPQKFTTSDTEAAALIQKSIEQYKLICKYIRTLPASISTFEDAVTFPGATFRVQAAASHLNVDLLEVQEYLAGMRERLDKVRGIVDEYKATLRHEMPGAVDRVLQTAYAEAYKKGAHEFITTDKYPLNFTRPVYRKPELAGGATQLAAYVSHATALGYYDGGPDRVSPPPIPARPTRMPMAPPPIPPRSTKLPLMAPPIPPRPAVVPKLPPPVPSRPSNVPDIDPLLGRPVFKRTR